MRQPEYAGLDHLPAIGAYEVPWLSVDEMRAVDRIAIEMGMLLERMMENAGRSLTAVGRQLLGGSLTDKRVVILVRSGGNGGGGLVAARHLASAGAAVTLMPTEPPR
jgi:NAD(P)H-hydrate epimerase